MKQSKTVIFVMALNSLLGCQVSTSSNDPASCPVASEGCPCNELGQCAGDLTCASNLCVAIGTDTSAAPDNSTQTSGSTDVEGTQHPDGDDTVGTETNSGEVIETSGDDNNNDSDTQTSTSNVATDEDTSGEAETDTGMGSTDSAVKLTTSLVAQYGLNIAVIGIGNGVNPEQLNAIVSSGDSPFGEYIAAESDEDVFDALEAVADTVSSRNACRFKLESLMDVDRDRVNLQINDTQIPLDENCTGDTGWRWLHETDYASFELCPNTCVQYQQNADQEITILAPCPAS